MGIQDDQVTIVVKIEGDAYSIRVHLIIIGVKEHCRTISRNLRTFKLKKNGNGWV